MELHWRQDEKSYHWEHLLQFHAQFESQVDKMPDQKRNKKNYHCQSQAQGLNLLWWPGGFFGYHYNEFYKEKNNNIETCHLLTFSTTDEYFSFRYFSPDHSSAWLSNKWLEK